MFLHNLLHNLPQVFSTENRFDWVLPAALSTGILTGTVVIVSLPQKDHPE